MMASRVDAELARRGASACGQQRADELLLALAMRWPAAALRRRPDGADRAADLHVRALHQLAHQHVRQAEALALRQLHGQLLVEHVLVHVGLVAAEQRIAAATPSACS